MSNTAERQIIEYEAARNKAMDEWFGARPEVHKSRAAERVFEGGFRMAYDVGNAENQKLREKLESSQRWIPVSERIPGAEVGDHLCYFQGRIAILPFIGGVWRWGDGTNIAQPYRKGVTHWMPLPPAPKEIEQ